MRSWLIVGTGYVGERLAKALTADGENVVATTRSVERAEELGTEVPQATVSINALDSEESVASVISAGGIVVLSVPPREPIGVLEARVVRAAARAQAARLVYLSSTGVYGRGGDDWIDEDTATAPLAERGHRRLAAETAVLDTAAATGIEAVSLRIVGIYGPGRGVIARLRRGDYRIYGAGDALVCRVHVDDLVNVIRLAGTTESLPRPIYCIADDVPTSSREHAFGVADMLGIDRPPVVSQSEASPAARAMLGANRRVSNRRAKAELGWALRYKSWREGAEAIASELD